MAAAQADKAEGAAIGDFVPAAVTRRTVALCGLSILAEGYDVAIMGPVVLALRDDPHWALDPVELGALSSASLLGMLLGSLIAGTLADRYGRRRVLMGCIALFSLASMVCAMATTPAWFALARAVAGFGMGGLIPTAAAFTIEYSPRPVRSRNYGIMYAGYSLGAMAVSLIAIPVLSMASWRLLFWIGALPILMLPLIHWLLPSSFDWLVAHHRHQEARALAARLSVPAHEAEALIAGAPPSQPGASASDVASLFAPERRRATIFFWLSLAFGLLLVYGLSTWLPTLMRGQGYALGSSLGFLAVFSIASAFGGGLGGALADRFGERRVIALSYLVAGLASLGLGMNGGILLTYLFVALAGYGAVSTTVVLTGYATAWYPPAIRSTAVGWALGFARIGAICGPMLLGVVLAATKGNVSMSLAAIAGLSVITALLVIGIPAQVRSAAKMKELAPQH